MTRDDLPRDPLLVDAFQVLVREGASAAEPDGLVFAVRARVRRRRAARRVGAGATGLAVVAGALLAAPHVLPGGGSAQHGPAGTALVQGDYPVYTLEELLERADVVFEGRVLGVTEQVPASQAAAGAPTAIEHPGGDDLSIGWFCAFWDESTPFRTRTVTMYSLLGTTDEEFDLVWAEASARLEAHCGTALAEATGPVRSAGDPPVLLLGPDVNDLDLSVRLDPELTIHDLCPETDERGVLTGCDLQNVIEPFRAAFPMFEIDDDCSIRRLEPAPLRPAPESAPGSGSGSDDVGSAPEPEPAALRLVTLLVDTVHAGTAPASATVVVVQTVGSDWEPPLVEGGRYLVFGEHRADGLLNIVGGSAGGFADDGLGGWLPLLPASSPVRHLTAEQLAALLAGEGGILPGDDDGSGDGNGTGSPPPVHWSGRLPNWPAGVTNSNSDPTPIAAWGLDPGVLYVTTFGSSSCPAIVTDAAWEAGMLHLTLGFVFAWSGEPLPPEGAACTADLSPHTTIVRVPDAVDESADVPFRIAVPATGTCADVFDGTLQPHQTVGRDGAPFAFASTVSAGCFTPIPPDPVDEPSGD